MDLLEYRGVEVVGLRLGIQRQQDHFPDCSAYEIDEADATRLARTGPTPANLVDTAGAGDDVPSDRMLSDEGRELTTLLLGRGPNRRVRSAITA